MPDTTLDEPKALARAIALDMADESSEVGDFVTTRQLEDGVTDFRFEAHIPGYEGWQWSVTLYHDAELDHWTVNESSLLPTEQALLPPKWIPWKDRLLPTDLSVTDSIGTDPDDPRLERGLDDAQLEAVVDAVEAQDRAEAEAAKVAETAAKTESADDDQTGDSGSADEAPAADDAKTAPDAVETADAAEDKTTGDAADEAVAKSSALDMAEAIDEFELSRRHVLSPLGRAQAAKRWYDGPHGPKALSTKTAGGSVCESCGFFIPLKGDLNRMFGVCANKWSPDDGRVVSLDHGCGEHSEIDPPQPSRLWVQSKPAFDDLHIDIVAQKPRDEHAEVELLERMGEGHRFAGDDDEPEEPETAAPVTDDDVATEEDIDAQTVPDEDATDEDIAAHAMDADDEETDESVDAADDDADAVPEVVATVDLSVPSGDDDASEDAESDDSDETDSAADDAESDDDAADGTAAESDGDVSEAGGDPATDSVDEPGAESGNDGDEA